VAQRLVAWCYVGGIVRIEKYEFQLTGFEFDIVDGHTFCEILATGGYHQIDTVEIKKGITGKFVLIEAHGVVQTTILQLFDGDAQGYRLQCTGICREADLFEGSGRQANHFGGYSALAMFFVLLILCEWANCKKRLTQGVVEVLRK
jgi:hypothetical protein